MGGSRRGHHHDEGQGPEGEPLPNQGEAMDEEAQGVRTSPPLSRWRRSAIGRGIITAVIVFINITIIIIILISFMPSTLPDPTVITYLNMVLYATYYDPMMCCHPMMF